MNFSKLGISEALVQALEKESITTPMAMQIESIPVVASGKNCMICAPTGTGKTLAYLLPLIERMEVSLPVSQLVVLAPTHELASQIHQQVVRLAQYSGLPFKSLLLIGGVPLKRQQEKLKKKPQVVVGSAGRILELVRMKKLKLNQAQSLVIDEADRLLSGERLGEIRALVERMPQPFQLVCVSATEQTVASRIVQELAPNIVRVSCDGNQVNTDIHHLYFKVESRSKADMLRKLIRAADPERAMVFVHRNKDAELVCSKLEHYGISVANLHGAQGKLDRKGALDGFRSGKMQILVASDVAARGLDVRGVTHIFNYDVPSSSKDYLHRVGRTGRAGAKGYAVSLMNVQEVRLVKRFEKELSIVLHPALIQEGQVFLAEVPADEDG